MPSLSFVESIELCDAIVVIGWDGFLLQAMRDFYKYQKPFLGLHAGTLWFLHNHMHVSELPTSLERLQIVESELLEVTCTQEDGTLVEALCVNDCIVGNHMIDYFTYDVLIW
jgi:NAD+ kinase